MRIGISVTCRHCGRTKAPRGRSVPDAMYRSYCQGYTIDGGGCIGWPDEPKMGDLWPGETEEDFGYPVSSDGTREVTA